MPRFYLNIRQDDNLIEDPEGHEFPSLVDARAEAVLSAREIMAARVLAGKRPNHGRFEITDHSGKLISVMWFEEAIEY